MDWRLLSRRDIVGLLLAAGIIVLLGVVYLAFPGLGQRANFGFGPDWACTDPGQGGPVCIRSRAGATGDPGSRQPTAAPRPELNP